MVKKREKESVAKEERRKEGSMDGGGQGDGVNCRVLALEEAVF